MRAQTGKRGRFIGAMLASAALAWGQLPMEPRHTAGQSITGAFEGWFRNPDGSFSILVGYNNRNVQEEIEIPVGPNNRIEPGDPDRGQPTHFMPGRMWGVFIVNVPKDFGAQKLTWTIEAHGKPTVIPLSLNPLWEIAPFIDATNNTPPFLSFETFDKDGPTVQGPRALVNSLKTTVGQPLALTLWAADDVTLSPGRVRPKAPITVTWSKFRGPGTVTFANSKPAVEAMQSKMPPKATFGGKATTTATFSDPGEYVLYVAINDSSGVGGGGFQCCWTNGVVNVSVGAAEKGER